MGLSFSLKPTGALRYVRPEYTWALLPPILSCGLESYFDSGHGVKFVDLVRTCLMEGLGRYEAQKRMVQTFPEVDEFEYLGEIDLSEIIINHASTRARELDRLDRYRKAGVSHYRIRSILDWRTSAVERALDGETFDVEDATRKRDKLLGTTSLLEASQIAPLITIEDLDDFAEFREKHLVLPPLVPGCRAGTVLYKPV